MHVEKLIVFQATIFREFKLDLNKSSEQACLFTTRQTVKLVSRHLIYLILSTINKWFLVVKRHACSLLFAHYFSFQKRNNFKPV